MFRFLSVIAVAALFLSAGSALAHHQVANCGSCGAEAHDHAEGDEAEGEAAGCAHHAEGECDCEHGEAAAEEGAEAAGCEHHAEGECDCQHGEEATDEAADEATEETTE